MSASPATVARRWFEEIWNQRHLDIVDELMAPDAIGHVAPEDITGPGEFRRMHAALCAAFPDQKVRVLAIAAEGENVFVHWEIKGTHHGPLFDLPASGKKFEVNGMTRFVVRDGKVVEGWDCWDSGKLFAHLRG